jgi:hypothetical protein
MPYSLSLHPDTLDDLPVEVIMHKQTLAFLQHNVRKKTLFGD